MLRTVHGATVRRISQLSGRTRVVQVARPLGPISSWTGHYSTPRLSLSPSTTVLRQHLASTSRFYSSEPAAHQTSFADPDRPELFYHLFHPQDSTPVFALSFLPDAPKRVDSYAVLGWLPALEGGEAGLNDFKENRTWTV